MFAVVRLPGGVYPVARSEAELCRLKAKGGKVWYCGPASGWSERFR